MHISLHAPEMVEFGERRGELGAEQAPPSPFPFLAIEGLLATELFPTGDFFPNAARAELGLEPPILITGGAFRPSPAE